MYKIAFISGKGGTGKTTVAINFAKLLSYNVKTLLVDLDVEEPNDNLFFKYKVLDSKAYDFKPEFDLNMCTYCMECSKKCQYGAIAVAPKFLKFFEELCHGCTACKYICKYNAIKDSQREIGTIYYNLDSTPSIVYGYLKNSSTMTTELIRQVKRFVNNNKENFDLIVYDCPPGNSCPAIEAVKDADTVIVVAEPTPFGLHDFKIIVETLKIIGKPFYIFINKDDSGFSDLENYCINNNLKIVGRIKYSETISKAYAKGLFICESKEVAKELNNINNIILNTVSNSNERNINC